MPFVYGVAVLLSASSFLIYGLLCLFSDGMEEEFERFGLSRYRRLTGALEVLGAVGLAVGVFVTEVMVAASAGLALLMVLGVITRVRVRDSFVETLPAVILLCVNLFILLYAWNLVGAP